VLRRGIRTTGVRQIADLIPRALAFAGLHKRASASRLWRFDGVSSATTYFAPDAQDTKKTRGFCAVDTMRGED
jgi:hypothetical protein